MAKAHNTTDKTVAEVTERRHQTLLSNVTNQCNIAVRRDRV